MYRYYPLVFAKRILVYYLVYMSAFFYSAQNLFFIVLMSFFAAIPVFAGNPVTPILPSDNIQDPGSGSTPWGGCGPTDSNCYVSITTSQWTTTGSHVYYNTGNVGVGDTTPSALLTVGSGDAFQINSSGAIAAATGLTTSGTVTISSLGGGGAQCLQVNSSGVVSGTGSTCGGGGSSTWNGITNPTGSQSLTFDDGELTTWTVSSDTETFQTITANALTTGKILSLGSTSLTSGTLLDITSNGTAAATGQKGLNIALSGTNVSASQTTYGAYISNEHTGTSANSIGLYATASNTGGYTAEIVNTTDIGVLLVRSAAVGEDAADILFQDTATAYGELRLRSAAGAFKVLTDYGGGEFVFDTVGGTDDILSFGGTTSANPAIKVNGTSLQFRLADNSADTTIIASGATLSGITGSTQCLQVNSSGVVSGAGLGCGGGVTTMATIGSSPNANGATISGSTLTLQPASASFGGVVTTGTQTFAGAKTFSADITSNGLTIGRGALGYATNTAFGISTLTSITTGGEYNVAVGNLALDANTTGTNNTALGSSTLTDLVTASDNTALGSFALFKTTGGGNTAVGSGALSENIGGVNNTIIGYSAGSNLTTGDYNIFIGALAQPTISNTGSNQLNIGNWIYGDNGNIGVGDATPNYRLDVADTGVDSNIFSLTDSDGECLYNPEAGSVVVSCSSDERLKANIIDAGSALSYFAPFKIRQYDVIASGNHMTGVIAQEVLQTHPELVTLGDAGMYTVQLPNQWQVVKAIQELDIQVRSITDLTESTDTSFVAHLRAWLANAGNRITRIFTGEICLTDPDGTSECLNKTELYQLKQLLNNPATQGDTTSIENPPADEPTPPSEDQGTTDQTLPPTEDNTPAP
jgi:hypothetical protein